VTAERVLRDRPLRWQQVAAIADGAVLELSDDARRRIDAARALVEAAIGSGVRAYGVNTGVGALCDVIVHEGQHATLSRNIVMSHAVGVGPALGAPAVRAIMAAAVNNFAHGYSGVRLAVVERLLALLAHDCIPEVPSAGSVGYLTHMAHVALVLLGLGEARHRGRLMSGAAALRSIDLEPLVLGAKEGLSLVNGTPCATGLSAIALARAARLLDWADAVAAMSFENLHGQVAAFDPAALQLRVSAGVADVGGRLRALLGGSAMLHDAGRRTQDPLSLRAIPQVHGAARDVFAQASRVVDEELASVTDNPVVLGTLDAPRALSGANAVGAALGLSADALGVAIAQVAAMSERRMDRLVNPLVSGLPGFLAADGGVASGFMIAQYTAVSLVADNRRLAAPSSLDGGVTSGLQEDHLVHATPGALKLLSILDNAETILAIELLAAAQAYELQRGTEARAARTEAIYRRVRADIAHYRDDRPLGGDIEKARRILGQPLADAD